MNRTGKIAKLPPEIREALNHQLERGVPGRMLVAWLNSHPSVQAVLRECFGGAPVNEQNLSAWRRGGFLDWQVRRQFFDQVREVAADAGDFEVAAARMADHAARLLSAHYALALSKLPSPRTVSGPSQAGSGPCPYAALSARLKPLSAITRTVTALRRGEHEDARLKMQMARPTQASTTASYRAFATDRHPAAAPIERGDQGVSSQIKVPEIPEKKNPADVPSAPPVAVLPPDAPENPPASPPPRLTLTSPPALHFFASQVA